MENHGKRRNSNRAIRNTTFHSQCINWNENNLITSINASISYEFKDNFKQSP